MTATTSLAGPPVAQLVVIATVALLVAVGTLGTLAGWLFGLLAAARARVREAEAARLQAMSERAESDDLARQWRDYAESREPESLGPNGSVEAARPGPRQRFALATLAALHAVQEL